MATPELLDHLVENALSLRFDDRIFARAVYADFLAQAISAAERSYDVQELRYAQLLEIDLDDVRHRIPSPQPARRE